MKYLKMFESFEDIDSICKEYWITNYTINSDGSIDVEGNVNLSNLELTKLPLKFGRVGGNFNFGHNELTTLKGSPREVGGNFFCSHNKLTTLEGGPREVGGSFGCSNNQLTTLEGAPREVGGDFYCSYNQLYTLKGLPRIRWDFSLRDNPVYAIYVLFKKRKVFMDSLDWDYIRRDKETKQNQIVKSRFEEACAEVGIEVPESIEGYEYI